MQKSILVAAGRQLREIRDGIGFRLWEVEQRTEDRFGRENRIQEATLSRIERGVIQKPPSLLDTAELGVLYDLPPRKFFELYELPVAGKEPLSDPDAINQLRHTLRELTEVYDRPDLATDLLSRVSYEATYAIHRAKSA